MNSDQPESQNKPYFSSRSPPFIFLKGSVHRRTKSTVLLSNNTFLYSFMKISLLSVSARKTKVRILIPVVLDLAVVHSSGTLSERNHASSVGNRLK